MVLETTFRTATGTLVLVDAMVLGPDDRGHQLGAGAPGALLRRLGCTGGQVTVEVAYAPRPEYGLIHPLLTQADGGLSAAAAPTCWRCPHRCRCRSTARPRPQRSPCARARQPRSRRTTHGVGSRPRRCGTRPRSPSGWTTRSVAGVPGRAAPGLRGALEGPRPPLRPGAAGAHLPAHRRDRGRRHHLAARDHRRGTQLGLPLHLGARRQPDHGGPVGGRLPGRGQPVLRLPRRRRPDPAASRPRPADHVRDRRRARPHRAGAAPPAWLAGQPAGAGRQRRLDPAPAGRVRRAAGGGRAAEPAARRAGPGDRQLPGGGRRRRRGPLARAGPRHLGGPRRAARLPVLQAAVLGGP
jgi:hypothetical protein